MRIRPRRDDDLDACVAMAERTKHNDHYPLVATDLRAFMSVDDALEAWVVEVDGAVVGHVALRPGASAPVLQAAARVTGLEPDGFGVVARLVVYPEHRRIGAGRALMDHAEKAARRLGRWPILDVPLEHRGGIALYDRSGWVRTGPISVTYGDAALSEYVYVAPGWEAATGP